MGGVCRRPWNRTVVDFVALSDRAVGRLLQRLHIHQGAKHLPRFGGQHAVDFCERQSVRPRVVDVLGAAVGHRVALGLFRGAFALHAQSDATHDCGGERPARKRQIRQLEHKRLQRTYIHGHMQIDTCNTQFHWPPWIRQAWLLDAVLSLFLLCDCADIHTNKHVYVTWHWTPCAITPNSRRRQKSVCPPGAIHIPMERLPERSHIGQGIQVRALPLMRPGRLFGNASVVNAWASVRKAPTQASATRSRRAAYENVLLLHRPNMYEGRSTNRRLK